MANEPSDKTLQDEVENLKVLRGDTKLFTVNIASKEDPKVPTDLTGALIVFTAKKRREDPDIDAVISLSVGRGITITDSANGQFQVKIPAATTNVLEIRRYFYDIQIDLQSGDRETPLLGMLDVRGDITRT